MVSTIRTVFSPHRQIDRTIEKVIDYYAQEEDRLAQEVAEYEVTDNIEGYFRKFIDIFGEGIRRGGPTEIGIWVSGFYGSGKSSYTKYLGAALDPTKTVHERPFLDLLCERFRGNEIPAALRTVAKQHPTAVIMLDLATEQLSESAATPVSKVLYWKVLKWAGISRDTKIARLEITLERREQFDDFKAKYYEKYGKKWEEIHNDPLIGVVQASEIVPQFLPEAFPSPETFRNLRFEEALDLRDIAAEIIDICFRKARKENPKIENLLFFIDEAGQYVAPRGELILNLDGLARNFKELGMGKVWIVATGQQTLNEIVERAAYNSDELNKLRDRFPISIPLDARDIREITHRRLLEKSEGSRALLIGMFGEHGQALVNHTRLVGTSLFKGDPDAATFSNLYPFLPQHFDLLLELIKTLARSTGGIGLRSAIRVIQDVLVDKSRVLPPDAIKLADREVGALACVDDFYDTLRADIAKVLPHVVSGVDKVERIFADRPIVIRTAKAVAALQPIETFPRTADNIAALLYPKVGSPSLVNEVREALGILVAEKECGLIEDPQAGGFVFLSDAVKPIRENRNTYTPTSGQTTRVKIEILKQGVADHPLFNTQPSARLGGIKEVKAAVKLGRNAVIGGSEDVNIRIESVEPTQWDAKRGEFLLATNQQADLNNTIILLVRTDDAVEELLPEIVKSDKVVGDTDERTADRDVAQFLRSERRLAERHRETVAAALENTLLDGTFIFRGIPTPVREAGAILETAIRNILGAASEKVYQYYHLAPIRPATDAAAKFLSVDRLDRVDRALDPLGLVIKSGGTPRIDVDKPVLAEVLRVFRTKATESGSGRLSGSYLQDRFSSADYGWTKDTVRYLFAALLRAGEVEFHIPGDEGPVKTAGPQGVDAVKSTVAFNRIGVSPRDVRVPLEALDRSARRLETLFGEQVLPLEDHISRAVRLHVPDLLETIGALPDRLRLLELPGEERAQRVLADAADLLKGDAGNAAAALGGNICPLPEEITWARAVFTALERGAEDDVKHARAVLRSLHEIESLFPGTSAELLPETERETANDILGSDRFYGRLPDLRGVIRGLVDRAADRYLLEKASYAQDLRIALANLESDPYWPTLLDEDRKEIAKELEFSLPETADTSNPVKSLQTIISKRRMLADTVERLRGEIRRRLPPEPEVPEFVEEPTAEEVFEPEGLIDPGVIATKEELEVWLDSLRRKMLSVLNSYKKIRIVNLTQSERK